MPIRPDYVGKIYPAPEEQVRLSFRVDGAPDAVCGKRRSREQRRKSELRWQRKDLLGIREPSADEITFVLDTADAFKDVGTREIKKVPALRGKTLVNFLRARAPGRRSKSRPFAQRGRDQHPSSSAW
jgi:hypothetical protein